MEPSAAPAATSDEPGALAILVTAGTTPLSRAGGIKLWCSTPRRTSHTARRSSAAVTTSFPFSSAYTGHASGDAITPNARACSYRRYAFTMAPRGRDAPVPRVA